jgi:undecaprenyl-diphosphatase
VAAYSLLTGRCRITLLILVIAFALNPLVEVLLKEVLIDRSRPDMLPLGRGRGASFPSGHVMAAIGFYGMLPALVSEATGRYRARIAAFLAAGVIILAVGFSRIYMGVHWVTDVMGGFLIGAVVILSTYEALQGHRLDRNRCEGCPPEARELQGWLGWRVRAPSRAP